MARSTHLEGQDALQGRVRFHAAGVAATGHVFHAGLHNDGEQGQGTGAVKIAFFC